ncbi:hypothetical protein CLSAB_03350 [Clostridium saccharobutylicum]|uniref:hypothetical protein n=2 Tax=Clostridium saccharobutylicum TaxID=169679 RepID=UPI00098C482E|nr:hypothetical protein [Clostridium saccharobutylicum]MBC2438043.1 hypothetical protein [Clostridium saccharobutylicum]NSB90504.1 hypothetical protein [Clostridium saccharobutylicum]NYC31559.1 hypothetical protein [Clostridium saccharobutylicum]OOM18877.1 hypothetical protein CLSAB_03350 [Clostridium saccharobutylicum]
MAEQTSKERAEQLIATILEKRESAKSDKAYITGAKEELEQFLIENDLTEWTCPKGTVKIADSVREGLEKEKVESTVTKVNAKQIDHIEIKDLYKQIDVHSISIKAKKEN